MDVPEAQKVAAVLVLPCRMVLDHFVVAEEHNLVEKTVVVDIVALNDVSNLLAPIDGGLHTLRIGRIESLGILLRWCCLWRISTTISLCWATIRVCRLCLRH